MRYTSTYTDKGPGKNLLFSFTEAYAETAESRFYYVIGNHLGNVLSVVTDRRIPHNGGSGIDYYTADIVSANDYYSFGAPMPGRTFNGGDYRYGFNGKENDNEVKGNGNQQDFGARIYDPRVGRFLSLDPLGKKFPFYTPYQFAGNTPIQAIDLDGNEVYYAADGTRIGQVGTSTQVRVVSENIPLKTAQTIVGQVNGGTMSTELFQEGFANVFTVMFHSITWQN